MIEIKKEVNFDYLYENSWSGAVDTLQGIKKLELEDQFMDMLNVIFEDQPVDETNLNDFIWFEDDYIAEYLDITVEELYK